MDSTEGSDDIESNAERLIYDCTPWAGESRRLFASMLDIRGLQNAWQGTEVTVFSADRELVDEIVDEVLATTRPAINVDAPTLVYEVADWPSGLQNEFAEQLTISEVPYAWDAEGNLVVNESDEELVIEVLDMLPSADDFDDADGLQVQAELNEAFMLCDRIAAKPGDDAAIADLRALVSQLHEFSVPFGFEDRQWAELVGQIAAVCAEGELSHKSRAKLAKSAYKKVRQFI